MIKNTWQTAVILISMIALITLVAELSGVRLYERIATHLFISMVLVIGLQCFMGNSGLLSFAHVGFMGIGAYCSALLTIPAKAKGMALPELYPFLQAVEWHPLFAMLAAGLLAAFIAALIAWPLMRLAGAAAVITSFALLVVLHTVLNNWSALTNGPRTLFGLPKTTDLLTAAVIAVLALLLALAFKESRSGKLLRASREDETAAAAMGANIPLLRWQAFVLAAFIAGIGGALWGHFITSFAPKAFYLKETFFIISMLVIGGAGTVSGAVFGSILITLAYELLRSAEGSLNSLLGAGKVAGLTEMALALAMILVMALRPGGLFATRELGTLLGRWRRKGASDD